MLPGFPADPSAARSRADRAAAAAGRLAAGLAAALGVAAPLHWHIAGQPQAAPHTLGAAWALAGIAAWCSGAHRRSAALAFGWLGLAVGVWARPVRRRVADRHGRRLPRGDRRAGARPQRQRAAVGAARPRRGAAHRPRQHGARRHRHRRADRSRLGRPHRRLAAPRAGGLARRRRHRRHRVAGHAPRRARRSALVRRPRRLARRRDHDRAVVGPPLARSRLRRRLRIGGAVAPADRGPRHGPGPGRTARRGRRARPAGAGAIRRGAADQPPAARGARRSQHRARCPGAARGAAADGARDDGRGRRRGQRDRRVPGLQPRRARAARLRRRRRAGGDRVGRHGRRHRSAGVAGRRADARARAARREHRRPRHLPAPQRRPRSALGQRLRAAAVAAGGAATDRCWCCAT